METTDIKTQEPASNEIALVEKKLNESIETANKYFTPMQTNALACKTYLSKYVNPFNTQEENDQALNILGQVKPVYEKIVERRKQITGGLDELKKLLMIPEKTIEEAVAKTKAFCDQWNTKLLAKQQEEQKAIEAKKNKDLERASLKNELIKRVSLFITETVSNIDKIMIQFFSEMNLENFDKRAANVKAPRTLTFAIYEGLFTGLPITKHLTVEEAAEVVNQVKQEYTFETVSQDYAQKMAVKMEPWIGKLDTKKQELEDLAKLSQEEAAKIQKDNEAKAAAAIKEAEETAQKETESVSADLDKKAETENLSIEFGSQISSQTMTGGPSDVRKNLTAVFDCQPNELATIIPELVFMCITHPKHPGIFAKDKSGNIKTDAEGNQVYAEWVENLLTFYVNNCKQTIKGIKPVTKVSTITRKAK